MYILYIDTKTYYKTMIMLKIVSIYSDLKKKKYIYIYIYIFTNIYIRIHTYIHIYIHTYIYICTHTHTQEYTGYNNLTPYIVLW